MNLVYRICVSLPAPRATTPDSDDELHYALPTGSARMQAAQAQDLSQAQELG